MINENPPALERLWISIQSIASRTVSRITDLINDMRASGVGDDTIRTRIKQELTQGTALAEMRNFATARVPGFVGEMVFRFARDTLADKQRTISEISAQVDKENLEAMNKKILNADGTEKTRLQQIQDAYKNQGIDITAYENELPEPPPDAPVTDEYMWVAVEDSNTCSVCAGNHGKVRTLREWSIIGEPRAGACFGEQHCRCILIPATALTKKEQAGIVSGGPLNIKKPKRK